jgi:hypothetical protein
LSFTNREAIERGEMLTPFLPFFEKSEDFLRSGDFERKSRKKQNTEFRRQDTGDGVHVNLGEICGIFRPSSVTPSREGRICDTCY